jgi:flagellin
MELSLKTNIQSMIAQNSLYIHNQKLNKELTKATTGSKINSASDDAAGVSVSDGLLTQIKGNRKAMQAVEDGSGILKTAEGGLLSISSHIQRIRELAVQAANDINTTTERRALVTEVSKRVEEITRLSEATNFNHVKLLNGTASQLRIQTGSESDVTTNTINIGDVLVDASANALGFGAVNITADTGGIFSNGTSARSFLNTVDSALNNLNDRRAQIAAYSNRLESILLSSSKSIEGYTRSYSSIKDADIANVTSNIAKQNILRESSTAIMMQANSKSDVALQLLAA